jgi:hypothetical protein
MGARPIIAVLNLLRCLKQAVVQGQGGRSRVIDVQTTLVRWPAGVRLRWSQPLSTIQVPLTGYLAALMQFW